jgi:hypothetical protein
MSKVDNIGLRDIYAENTKIKNNRFKTIVDDTSNVNFMFENTPYLNANIISQFKKPNSLVNRIISKLRFF